MDIWALGCIFAELILLRPLFLGEEQRTPTNALQLDQLSKCAYQVPATDQPLCATQPAWAASSAKLVRLRPIVQWQEQRAYTDALQREQLSRRACLSAHMGSQGGVCALCGAYLRRTCCGG